MATRREAAFFTFGFVVAAVLSLGPRGQVWAESPGEPGAANEAKGVNGEKSLKREKSAKAVNREGTKGAKQAAAELRGTVRAALKTAASAKDHDQQEAARALVRLYQQLEQDSSLNVTERAGLRAAVRYRLARISKQLQSRVARETAAAPRGKQAGATQQPIQSDSPPGEFQQFPMAAQQFGFPPQQNPWVGAAGANRQGQFGPGLFGQTQAAQQPADRGQELVELIENTIAPDTWAVHGGEGTIHYFRPAFALIVNQSANEHDQLGGLLQQLRK
jgi:hypothetical protein